MQNFPREIRVAKADDQPAFESSSKDREEIYRGISGSRWDANWSRDSAHIVFYAVKAYMVSFKIFRSDGKCEHIMKCEGFDR